MALLANQIMDARLLSSMNGRVELSQFLRVTNPSIASQVNSPPEDNHKNRKYPCPLCGKRFRFNSILSLHMRTHTGEKPFKCPYCDHRAAQKGNLKIHLRTHKQSILGKGRGRIREENRLLHELEERAILRDRQMRTSHVQQTPTQQQSSPLTQTVIAQPQFMSNSGLSDTSPHTSTSPVTTLQDEPPQPAASGFRCSFCKGKFRKQQELERHIRILHKPYKCTLCEFAASHEEELIGHVETTHITADSSQGSKATTTGSSDKVKAIGEFPCEVCGQTFSQAWFLKGHMRKHKDSFEHCCQICGRRFKEPWFLKNHMKVHLNKLAAKSNLTEHNASVNMLTQEHPSSLYSQYMSRIHNRFLSRDRDQSDFNHMIGVDIKVREMLQRMMSPSGSLADVDATSLLGLSHPYPPLSMEYLQKVITNNNSSGGSSSSRSGYPGWHIMTPGPPANQHMFTAKSQPQQGSSFLPGEDGDQDNRAISRPSSPSSLSHHGEIIAETGNSHSSSGLEHTPQSASPTTGENVYMCPPSTDYVPGQAACMGLHLDRYHFPHWQNTTDLISPLQPNNTSPPNSKLRPRSREDFSPAASHYMGLESENTLLIKKQADVIDKEQDTSVSSQTRKSQYEPLDLSVRPDSVPSLVQMPGVFTNGLTSSMTRRLQSFELGAAFHCDLKTKDDTDHVGFTGHNGEAEKSETGKETENDDSAKWKKNNILEEVVKTGAGFQSPGEKLDPAGQWGRAITESAMSSLESLTPGQAVSLPHQVGLLSFLRSQSSVTPASATKSMMNGSEGNDAASARKPFQCRYCPYSASQKGNLKTHVLCVHRKPFDNSLYPDRRLRRSHAPQRPSRVAPSITGDNRVPERDQIGMTSLCGT